MEKDQRRAPRYALEVDCLILGDEPEDTLRARTRNLSRSGISCQVTQPLDAGAAVILDLALSFGHDEYSEPVRLPATVMWCTQVAETSWQLGLRFGQLRPESRRFLDLFIAYLDGLERSDG